MHQTSNSLSGSKCHLSLDPSQGDWSTDQAWGKSVKEILSQLKILYVWVLSHVQPCDLMNCTRPRFSVHEISQVRILPWVTFPSFRGSSRPRDRTRVSCICCTGVNVKVARSCPTLCDLTDYTAHGILQARILEWVAFPLSRGSSQPMTCALAGGFVTTKPACSPLQWWETGRRRGSREKSASHEAFLQVRAKQNLKSRLFKVCTKKHLLRRGRADTPTDKCWVKETN